MDCHHRAGKDVSAWGVTKSAGCQILDSDFYVRMYCRLCHSMQLALHDLCQDRFYRPKQALMVPNLQKYFLPAAEAKTKCSEPKPAEPSTVGLVLVVESYGPGPFSC